MCLEYHQEKTTPNKLSDSGLDHKRRLDLRAGVLKNVKSLVTNGPYTFLVLHTTFDAILINGFVAFGPKYFQQQFFLTATMAGVVFG